MLLPRTQRGHSSMQVMVIRMGDGGYANQRYNRYKTANTRHKGIWEMKHFRYHAAENNDADPYLNSIRQSRQMVHTRISAYHQRLLTTYHDDPETHRAAVAACNASCLLVILSFVLAHFYFHVPCPVYVSQPRCTTCDILSCSNPFYSITESSLFPLPD